MVDAVHDNKCRTNKTIKCFSEVFSTLNTGNSDLQCRQESICISCSTGPNLFGFKCSKVLIENWFQNLEACLYCPAAT